MPDDDWISKIHKDRQDVLEKQALEAKDRLERRRNFEARADDFWRVVSAELERVVAKYNAEADEDVAVVADKSHPRRFTVTGQGARVEIEMDKASESIKVRQHGHSSSSGVNSHDIVQSKTGELVFRGPAGAEGFARTVLGFFFRNVGFPKQP
jgi:hypothetical protein